MSIKLKLILNSPIFLIKLIHLSNVARKYRKYPEQGNLQKQNDFVFNLSNSILKFYNVKVIVKGLDNVPKGPALIVANHNDNLDVLALMNVLTKPKGDKSVENPLLSFLSKIELKKKHAIRNAIELLDGVFIDRDNMLNSWRGLVKFGENVKMGRRLGIIFPEGTRGSDATIGAFKNGAFKLAQINFFPIVPTTINYSRVGLDSKRKKSTVEIIFAKPIKSNDLLSLRAEQLNIKVRNIIVENFISGEAHD